MDLGIAGGEVLRVITSTAVLRVFAMTGLDRVIPNFASLQEALVQAPAAARPDQPAQKAATGATE